MAGADMPLAPSGEPWFIIHFVLTAPFLSSLFRSCQKSRRGWNWSPVKEIPPGGAIDRCGAPGATDPMSGWSMDGNHQPSRVNLPLLSNSTLADANKCCSVIAEHLYSLNVQFLCSIFSKLPSCYKKNNLPQPYLAWRTLTPNPAIACKASRKAHVSSHHLPIAWPWKRKVMASHQECWGRAGVRSNRINTTSLINGQISLPFSALVKNHLPRPRLWNQVPAVL